MMGQMSLDINSVEKSEKKNDQESGLGLGWRNEAGSLLQRQKAMHNEMIERSLSDF